MAEGVAAGVEAKVVAGGALVGAATVEDDESPHRAACLSISSERNSERQTGHLTFQKDPSFRFIRLYKSPPLGFLLLFRLRRLQPALSFGAVRVQPT